MCVRSRGDGISEDFLENLYSEPDDWSLVVKLSALIEAAMTHLVTEAVGKPELRDAFASTDLAHTRAGKLVLPLPWACSNLMTNA